MAILFCIFGLLVTLALVFMIVIVFLIVEVCVKIARKILGI